MLRRFVRLNHHVAPARDALLRSPRLTAWKPLINFSVVRRFTGDGIRQKPNANVSGSQMIERHHVLVVRPCLTPASVFCGADPNRLVLTIQGSQKLLWSEC